MSKEVATLQQDKTEAKRQAWAALNKYPVDPRFRWVTMDCQVLKAQEMRTSHLFNALKMIWNNSVDTQWIIQPYTEYTGVRKWKPEQRRFAVVNIFNELMNRPDRSKGMDDALRKMAEWAAKHGDISKLLKTK